MYHVSTYVHVYPADLVPKLPQENSNSESDISHGPSERSLNLQEPLLSRNNVLQAETSRTQDRNIGRIVRFEMKKILQVCIH